jgi:hypothetical protein
VTHIATFSAAQKKVAIYTNFVFIPPPPLFFCRGFGRFVTRGVRKHQDNQQNKTRGDEEKQMKATYIWQMATKWGK